MISKPTLLEHGPCRFLITDCPTDANVHSYVDAFKKRQVTSLVRACDPSYNTAALNTVGIQVYDLAFPDGDPPPDRVVDRWLDLVEKTFHGAGKAAAPIGSASTSSSVPANPAKQSQTITANSPPNALSTLSPNGHSHGNGNGNGAANGNDVDGGSRIGIVGSSTPKDGAAETKDAHSAGNGHSPQPSNAGVAAGSSHGPCIAVHCVAGLGRAPVLVAIALIEEGMSALDAIAFIRKKRRGALNAKQLKWLEQYQRRRKAAAACCAML